MTAQRQLKKFDPVTVNGKTYGRYQFVEYLPPIFEGRKCAMVKVLHSSDDNFEFALIRVVRLIDVRALAAVQGKK